MIQEQVPGGGYQLYTGGDIVAAQGNGVYLTNLDKEFTLTAPGTYRVLKPVTPTDVGVFSEDGAVDP